MEEKEVLNEGEEHDFSSLNKYFKEDSLIETVGEVKVKTITEDVSIGESTFESYESKEEVKIQATNYKVEKLSKSSKSKREFLESLEDDSLTLDTCTNVNRDWNNK